MRETHQHRVPLTHPRLVIFDERLVVVRKDRGFVEDRVLGGLQVARDGRDRGVRGDRWTGER